MNVFIVSDLHIWGPDDPLYSSLISLIRSRAEKGDTVVLAGDLFDLFVGKKKIFMTRFADFLKAVHEAGTRGVEIHYLEGNHDFLMQGVFLGVNGITLHSKDVEFEREGKRFYIAHGDTANNKDYSYRILRAFFRSLIMKFLVTIIPGVWLDKIGKNSSRYSRGSKPLLPAHLPTQRMVALRKIYRNYAAEHLALGFDFVVMGHCHDLDEMMFDIAGRPGQYINVGFPRVHGSFLSWSQGDERIRRERMP